VTEVEEFQGFVELVGCLFDERLNVQFKLIFGSTAIDEADALSVSLD
jgi:hypothetical protein